MGVKDVLGSLRDGGYGKKKAPKESVRSLVLTDEESKVLPEADESGEVCLMVYGKVSDGEFQISRVEAESEESEEE